MNSEDRNAISQFIHDLISWLKARLKGEKVSLKIVKLENRFAAVLRNVDNTNAQKNNTTNDGDVKYEIKENSKGKYVQAKVQVIRSSNPKIQEREIIDYVNNVVREGHDVTITFDNEESIVITGRTAWKLGGKDNYSDRIYLVKGNASGVIDEIIQTSQYKQSKPPYKKHRKGFAKNGFDYRTAYFRDLDGKYYRLRLSVGLNSDGKEAYNIGEIKEIPFPDKSVNGSKANEMISLNNKISQKDNVVNTHYTQESENNSSPEQNNDGNSYSFEDIDVYDEAQYNDFGWVRYNDVLSASEYSTLLSRYADYKHNKHNYPTTRFGEAVIHSSELPDVIMYVKGSIVSPQITKAVRIETDSYTASSIKGWILQNEYRQVSQPYSAIESLYGQEVLSICRKRDYEPFWEYQARTKRNGSPTSDTISGTEQDGTGSTQQNKTTDKAGLDNSAFSMPENDIRYSFEDDVASLTEQRQNGEISESEYRNELQRLMNEATEKYGAIPKGENPKVDVTVPKQVSDKRNTRRKNNKKES